MTTSTTTTAWQRVVAPGSDIRRLRRAVAALVDAGGTPHRLSRELAERGLHGGGLLSPTTEPRAILDDLLRHVPPMVDETDAVAARWRSLGVRAAVIGDGAYPGRLARRWPSLAAPAVLTWRGPAGGVPDRPAVAIVGARRATGYGIAIAAWLAESIARSGVVVVSGGAVGVDASAHGGALAAGGATVVVLGCGHDVAYPRPHAVPGGLFDRVEAGGGWIVSELLPDVRPAAGHVIARNRIVAGLVDAVVVVEGGGRSGSLRTAGVAADIGVPVLAVPGDVRAPGSVAPHRLLAEGAAPCTGPADVLSALGRPVADGDAAGDAPAPSALPDPVHDELARRWPRPVRTDELARATGTATGALLASLTRARMSGEVAEGPDGVRLARDPGRAAAGRRGVPSAE